jgi:hypothetical protein
VYQRRSALRASACSGIVRVRPRFDPRRTTSSGRCSSVRELAAFTLGSRLVLDDCVFLERVRLEVAARVVSARAITFAGGALLRVRWAEIALDEADFARPSTLSEATTWRSHSDLAPVRVPTIAASSLSRVHG